jgi:hypothetical protein
MTAVDVPAECGHCGLSFPSGIRVGPGVRLFGNRSQCPRCGAMASVHDGVWDARDQAYSVIRSLSLDDLAKMLGLLKGSANPEEAAASLSDVSELQGVAALLHRYGDTAVGRVFLFTLLTLAALAIELGAVKLVGAGASGSPSIQVNTGDNSAVVINGSQISVDQSGPDTWRVQPVIATAAV